MRVYYPGPDPETYHPRLKQLTRDKVFELPDQEARLFIDGGLLREAAPTADRKPQTVNRKPQTTEV